MLARMTTIYGKVRAIGAVAVNPGADAEGTRQICVDEEGSLYVRFAAGANVGPQVARAVHLASAALPAAGAVTSQTAYTFPAGLAEVTFWITYTRDPTGADTGFPRGRLLWHNGTEEAGALIQDGTIDSIDAAVGIYARRLVYTEEIDFPAPLTDAAVRYAYTVAIPKGAARVRLLLAEAGDVAKPGTALIAISGGY